VGSVVYFTHVFPSQSALCHVRPPAAEGAGLRIEQTKSMR